MLIPIDERMINSDMAITSYKQIFSDTVESHKIIESLQKKLEKVSSKSDKYKKIERELQVEISKKIYLTDSIFEQILFYFEDMSNEEIKDKQNDNFFKEFKEKLNLYKNEFENKIKDKESKISSITEEEIHKIGKKKVRDMRRELYFLNLHLELLENDINLLTEYMNNCENRV
jgi:tetrahydromethanopterin S-methyltransferase subunit G